MNSVHEYDTKISSKYKKRNTLTNISQRLAEHLEINDDQQAVQFLGLISLVGFILLLIIFTGLYLFLYKRTDNVRFRSKSNTNDNQTQRYCYNSNDSLSSERFDSEYSTLLSGNFKEIAVPPYDTEKKILVNHVVGKRASHTENYWNSHYTLQP
ncbi:uncharacterized protein LOC112685355 [Sipha flava]|uniref:Uncharacterized protein LOC112685355 n=1 Tax=Sipha flava TaxID=143950 RepID=A0A2S2QFG9_9HEMI|nr:uncharacterized protein LOC112685355 [Sipha flava]XP_025413003.1 uncharacterized protein LOC112685355 [Sipha flava]XP_025413009.1 uncharacterized protein LOC112685355 [Sipha flava]